MSAPSALPSPSVPAPWSASRPARHHHAPVTCPSTPPHQQATHDPASRREQRASLVSHLVPRLTCSHSQRSTRCREVVAVTDHHRPLVTTNRHQPSPPSVLWPHQRTGHAPPNADLVQTRLLPYQPSQRHMSSSPPQSTTSTTLLLPLTTMPLHPQGGLVMRNRHRQSMTMIWHQVE